MNLYELAYLITADLSETDAKEIDNQLIAFIQEEGGFLVTQNALIRKKLSYPIRKQAIAYLADIDFRTSAEKISSLEQKIKSNNNILRHLLLAKKELKAVPARKRRTLFAAKTGGSAVPEITKEKKIDLKDIDQKLEEILEAK